MWGEPPAGGTTALPALRRRSARLGVSRYADFVRLIPGRGPMQQRPRIRHSCAATVHSLSRLTLRRVQCAASCPHDGGGVSTAPSPRVSPPYCVRASSLPSSWRWSCLRRSPSSVRVRTHVRERSSPALNEMWVASSEQYRTCMTRSLAANVVSPGGTSTTAPANADPHRACSEAQNWSCPLPSGAGLDGPQASTANTARTDVTHVFMTTPG